MQGGRADRERNATSQKKAERGGNASGVRETGRFTVFGQKPPDAAHKEDREHVEHDRGERPVEASPTETATVPGTPGTAPRVRISEPQPEVVDVVDQFSEPDTAEDALEEDDKEVDHGRRKALRESPIRTKYSPDTKRDLRRKQSEGPDSAENLLNIARQYDRAQSVVGASDIKATTSKSSIANVGKMFTASLREVVTSSKDHNVVSAKLLQTLADTNEDELRGTLPPGAMAALSRHWSMEGIKKVCGVDEAAGQSDFHAMRDKGMFFCGYQDAAMKKQGLPSLFATEAALEDISSSDSEDEDQVALEARGQKAILRPEDDRLIMLHRVRGEAVMRRVPQDHEAVLDFGESRISVPRKIKEKGGQLQKVAVDLNDDGTGNIVITTQTPRRSCNSSAPNALADVLDLNNLEKQSRKQPNDDTHQVSRQLTRPPPSFKEWEAWREIQRQKRMESTDDAIRKMRDGPQETKTTAASAASARATKEESARTPKDNSQQVIARKAQRNEKETVIVAGAAIEPRDAAAPPDENELSQALRQMSVDPRLILKAAGREQSKSIASSEENGLPAVLSKRWTLKSAGGERLRIDFSAAMTVRNAGKPVNMSGSFTDEGSAGSRDIWSDFFIPMPEKSTLQRLKQKMFHCCGQDVRRSAPEYVKEALAQGYNVAAQVALYSQALPLWRSPAE
ncbi:C56G7.3 [Symbiodinium natans]|uniref:C56G7.3 protein n=1 Tax=Symbiodinium natans TaxID=878477 RepID=A0A812NT17_9DINO|nr:C56G7.3 [Symbiodinium natans]